MVEESFTSVDRLGDGSVRDDLPAVEGGASFASAPPNPLRPKSYEASSLSFNADAPPEGTLEVPRGAYFEPQPAQPSSAQVYVPELHPDPDELAYAIGKGRGGKKPRKKSVMWEVIRSLKAPDDLPLLSTSLPAPRQTLTQIRYTHHQLAQLLAQGKMQQEAGLITGYSPAYISILKEDPSFKELMSYYAMQEEIHHVNVLDRMRSLGLSTIDELQTRLEEDPSQFTNRELMEQVDLMLVKPIQATRGAAMSIAPVEGASAGVHVQVNFVANTNRAPEVENKAPPTIDITPSKLNNPHDHQDS